MAGELPALRAGEVRRALERAGFVALRQRGSHLTLRHPESSASTTIPVHKGDIKPSLLLLILKQANMTRDEFLALLRQ